MSDSDAEQQALERRVLRAHARLVRSVRQDCLAKVVPLGKRHLRELVREYVAHIKVSTTG